MTERGARSLAGIMVCCALMAGCADDGEPDVCRGPYPVPSGGTGEVSTLDLDFDGSGTLKGVLRLAPAVRGPATDLLAVDGGIFDLGDRPDCRSRYDVTGTDGEWSFEVNCDGEGVMKTFKVTVFDTLANLDEVVVEVTTPATTKKFAILRACESPLYRLE